MRFGYTKNYKKIVLKKNIYGGYILIKLKTYNRKIREDVKYYINNTLYVFKILETPLSEKEYSDIINAIETKDIIIF